MDRRPKFTPKRDISRAGTMFNSRLCKDSLMKTDFGFYFRTLISTGVLCALVYGLGGSAVEQHAPVAFGMLTSVMVGIGGMIKTLSPAAGQHQDN